MWIRLSPFILIAAAALQTEAVAGFREPGLAPAELAVVFLAQLSATALVIGVPPLITAIFHALLGRTPGVAFRGAAVLVPAAVYAVSWAFFVRFGEFPAVDVVRFASSGAANVRLAFRQEAVSIPGVIGVFAGSAALFWAGLGLYGACLRRPAGRLAFYLCIAVFVSSLEALSRSDPGSSSRLAMLRRRSLLHSTHPLYSAWLRGVERLTESRARLIPDIVPYLKPRSDPKPLSLRSSPKVVLVVLVESLRGDLPGLTAEGRAVMPFLSGLAREGHWFTRAVAQSSQSSYSDISIWTSLYPWRGSRFHSYSRTESWPRITLLDLMAASGMATGYFSAQNEDWGGMRNILETPRLGQFFDAGKVEGSPLPSGDANFARAFNDRLVRSGKLDDRVVVDRASAWIDGEAGGTRPIFIGVNLQGTHFPYLDGGGLTGPFQPAGIPEGSGFGWYSAESTVQVRNAYYNAAHRLDRELARLHTRALAAAGSRDNLTVVVAGDNGESFHEQLGIVTHGKLPFQTQLHVPLIFWGAVPPKIDEYPAELVDLAPTLTALLTGGSVGAFQGVNLLESTRRTGPLRLQFAMVSANDDADAVVVGGRIKLLLLEDTSPALFDLAADPLERRDIARCNPSLTECLGGALRETKELHAAYYRSPELHGAYCLPRPEELPFFKRCARILELPLVACEPIT